MEAAFWASATIRESIGESYENLYYTPVAWQSNWRDDEKHSKLFESF